MSKAIIINKKEYKMPKMSADTYMEYLDITEKIDEKKRYSKEDIEIMMIFICKAYGNEFTVEELKDIETGLDVAGIIMEFQWLDVHVGEELTKRMEKLEKNF